MNEINESVMEFLLEMTANILEVDKDDIDEEADLDEIGYESMSVNRLCLAINEKLDISLTPALFLSVTSLSALAEYLLDNHFKNVDQKL